MINFVVWALLTGFVTGGVWVGIVLRRQRRLIEQQPILLEGMRRRMQELDQVQQRLAEVEERLGVAERLLTRPRDEARLSPPSTT